MKTAPLPLPVRRGKGIYLELEDGRQIADCISSWWVNIHGHANETIAAAIYAQALQLEQVIFAGFTHAPAEKLAELLRSVLPVHLTKVFYSDDGSTAVEVALKMAFQYWINQGCEDRNSFIVFEGGYHGDTIGAMSLGHSSGFGNCFEPLMFKCDVVPYPVIDERSEMVLEREQQSLAQLELLLKSGRHAAVVIEPLVQGAAGMKMCTPRFLQELGRLCEKHSILLIYDEIMTGFGRTGDLFACVKSNTKPDIICLSKGITGGFMPLAVTVVTEEIYNTFLDDSFDKAFLHGHSYTANPLACAAAVASLDMLLSKRLYTHLEPMHRTAQEKYLVGHRKVRNLRTCGTIAAFEVDTSEADSYFNNIGPILKKKFLEANMLIRPLGNTVYLMPPYCITEEQVDTIYQAIQRVLDSLEERAV